MSSTLQEVRIPAPEFRGAAMELGKCRDLEACLDGPAGCIAGETRIYNPVTGEHTPVKELYEKGIAPIVQTLMGAIQAGVPFCKGVRKLYKVTLTSGRQCIVTENHIFLTSNGWDFLSSCGPGSRLLISAPCPDLTTEAPGLLVSPQDALRLSQTPSGSQESYLVSRQDHDVLLQKAAGTDLTSVPLQADAHEHSRVGLCEDDQDISQGYNHPHQQSDLHARKYYSPLLVYMADIQSHVRSEISSQVDASFQYGGQSLTGISPLESIALFPPDDDSKRLHALLLGKSHVAQEVLTRGALVGSTPEQLMPYSLFADMTPGLPGIPLQLRVYNPSSKALHSLTYTCKYDYTIQWDTVSSIEYVRTDEYFDLHVPIAEHYLAEGIWHHNTGKTYACLFKIHLMLTLYPGAKALVARKTNVALAGSAMATFREMLDPREPVTYFGGNKIKPAAFQYSNGSLMIVSGLDKPEKIRSFEFDLAYLNEATEMTVDDVEFVRSRLRHGKTPYHQLIMDVNPDAPTHWLNQRMIGGITTRLESRHTDNPRFWDAKTQDWTEAGREYIFGILGGLTGVRLARYRYGIWAAAEGTVYEDSWDRARNVIDRFSIPKEWPRYLVVDFGYTNPFVCQWFAVDPDGRLYRYREIYKTKTLVEDHAVTIAERSGWYHLLPKDHQKHADRPADWADPLPREIICDHDAEDRATLERHLRLFTTSAKKSISDGIQAVAARLRAAGDGKPRLYFLRDSLVERDHELARMKKPTCFEEEVESYVWRQGTTGIKEEPVDMDNHAQDSTRYMAAHLDLMDSGVSYFRDIWK